ncbi:pseudouridylate synthase PUS7L isoform X2 [Sphaeramia orbicularis]|uniref:Pseudouridylate synthase PUS7L n=2 Tax=Sphaeramia orbicularis TaxID=375764 RepID=A0A673C0N3_9TELE|nr:pseudouridylate synthase 7 homolog-like protein isoform X2 [Sphaeramia orbicularis]XP_030006906.1 pseudouridylate synthase 7 homolog-like protein isoform X2 [Sphaeramia orbicularis]
MIMKQDRDAVDIPAYFISTHEGFVGSVKNFAKDFVVTEIDIRGHQVNTPGSAEADTSDCAFTDNTNKTSKQDDGVPILQDTNVSAGCRMDVPISGPGSLDLCVILGQAISEELEQFVLTLKAESLSRQEFSLGCFADKHQRGNVHRAVRLRFPFLMTITNQTEIKVREDPDYRELSQLVTEDEAEDFFRFIDAKVQGLSYTFLPDENKEHRTAVHHFLSRRFGKLVETKSFSDQGRTSISVRLRERGRPKKRTAEDRKEEDIYTAFTLCKENLETLEAISYMSAALGVLPSDFTYAGIKDKRAITYQSMVVKKVSAQRLKEKAAEFEKRGIRLSEIRSVREPLKLGRLQGNHFDLVVRDLKPHEASEVHSFGADAHLAALVKEGVENVKVRGFVNYYGPQRFGSSQSVQSDQIGLALLKEDMVSAVRLFFTPEEGNDPQNQAKRHFLQTDNAKEALLSMPLSKARERLMLRALNRYGTGPEGCTQAWLSLPHSMRVFYPHAYCSRVWNEAVAHRLTILGHSAKQGDLVQEAKNRAENTGESSSPQIHVVTEQEEQAGVYTLGQVLLPMPGNTVKYPENAMGTWYQERLARDGLENCRFRVSGLKMNLPGCYRPLLAFPRNLRYCLQRLAREVTVDDSGERTEQTNGAAAGEQVSDTDSLALIVNFDLDSSCYATVCLREIMKFDP